MDFNIGAALWLATKPKATQQTNAVAATNHTHLIATNQDERVAQIVNYDENSLDFPSRSTFLTQINQHYSAPTVVQTVTNPDGSISIIQMEQAQPQQATHQLVTLPDGTHAIQLQGGLVQVEQGQQGVHTLAEVASVVSNGQAYELAGNTVAVNGDVAQEGHIIIAGDGGEGVYRSHIFRRTISDLDFGLFLIFRRNDLSPGEHVPGGHCEPAAAGRGQRTNRDQRPGSTATANHPRGSPGRGQDRAPNDGSGLATAANHFELSRAHYHTGLKSAANCGGDRS